MEDEYLTIEDIQKMLKICRNTAYKLIKLDAFPAVKIGKLYRVSKKDFLDFMSTYRYSKVIV